MGTIALFAIAFFMIIWGVRNWYIEIKPFLDDSASIPTYSLVDKLLYPFRWVCELPKAMPFIIDIAITLFAVGSLGMGAGLIGGITGIFLSNVISLIIIMRTYNTDLIGSIKITIKGE